MQANAALVSWHLISSTWAYVRWIRMCASSPLRGELHAGMAEGLKESGCSYSHSSSGGEGKRWGCRLFRWPPFAAGAKRRCQPPSRYPAGNFPSQLTAGGEEPFNNMSWGVAVNHPPKHTASGCLNKIWHMPHSLTPAYDKWSGNLITRAALR